MLRKNGCAPGWASECGSWVVVGLLLSLVVASGGYAATPAEPEVVTVYGTALRPTGERVEILAPSEAFGLHTDLRSREIRLGPLDTEALLQEDAERTDDPRVRVGVARELPTISAASGTWYEIPGVGRVWIATIISEGAFDVRLHFTEINIPEGGELYMYAPDGVQRVFGPYSGTGRFEHGSFWSGIFFGDTAVVEYFTPAQAESADLPFTIDLVMHGYVDTEPGGGLREGDCHEDVKCYPEWEDVSSCVARIKIVEIPWQWYCTASLLDTEAGDQTPYLLTAQHCVENQAQAETMIAMWKYESEACDQGNPSFVSMSEDADLLWNHSGIDVSLCMLLGELHTNTTPFYWTGWSSATVPSWTDLDCISHPDAAYKRITFGHKIGNYGSYKHNISWDLGTIESGSSGSGVWREDLGGQLYAGTCSTCYEGTGCPPEDPSGPCQYGRFDLAYPYISAYLVAGSDDVLEDNDSCGEAVLTSPGSYDDLVVKSVDEDWYQISVPNCHELHVTLNFTHVHGNINAYLYDACDGTIVASGTSTSNYEWIDYYNGTGSAHDYFLRVLVFADTRNTYDMSISLTDECTYCVATDVRSYRDHDVAGELYLDMGVSGGIEPREGGIQKLEIDLDTATGFSGGVTVDCSTTWSGNATGVADGNTVTVTFDTPLPDQAYCTVTLDCEAEVCVRSLQGDVDRNGTTATTDASLIKPFYGETPVQGSTVEYDVDANGVIATTDASLIKPYYGNTAPDCP